MDPGTLFELLFLGVLVAGSAMAGGRVFGKDRHGRGADAHTTRLLQAAYVLAWQLDDSAVRVDHILLVASATPSGAAALHRRGLALPRLAMALPPAIAPPEDTPEGQIAWTPEVEEAFREARQQAFSNNLKGYALPALLDALLSKTSSPVAQIMRDANVRLTDDEEPGEGRFVYLWNDARTPMEFVAETLEGAFEYNQAASMAAMLTAHFTGAAALGPFPRDRAEALIDAVTEQVYTGGHATCFTLERPELSAWVQTPNGPLPGA